jgi:hypothetical protein
MTRIFRRGFFLAGFSIAACSESTAPPEAAPQTNVASPAQTSTTTQGVIPQAQLDAMAKAAAVGTVLEQAEQERRKQMEAQGL